MKTNTTGDVAKPCVIFFASAHKVFGALPGALLISRSLFDGGLP